MKKLEEKKLEHKHKARIKLKNLENLKSSEKITLLFLNIYFDVVKQKEVEFEFKEFGKWLYISRNTFKAVISSLEDKNIIIKKENGKHEINFNELNKKHNEDGCFLYYNLLDLYYALEPTKKLIYLYLKSFSYRDLDSRYQRYSARKKWFLCSAEIIAEDLDLGIATVYRGIRHLTKEGFIKTELQNKKDKKINWIHILKNKY